MERIFITHIVPQDKILKYNLSIAACNFSLNLINGNVFDKVYSILPTFVRGEVEPFEGLVYSSLRNRGKVLSKFAPFLENLKLFRIIPSNSSIWYYNCTVLNALLIIMLKVFRPSVKQNMIILDYTPSTRLIDRFLLQLTNRMNSVIKLADSPLFTCKNADCLPGVVPVDSPSYPKITQIKKEFLISGVLSENISMLSMLLRAFSKMSEMTLHITGKALDLKLIKKYTDKYNNIIYHGMVPYDDYLRILHDTPFLLSTRNPDSPENQCNFPSKIIEALLHNRIIISTLHYNQLEGINYWKVSSNENDFINDIRKIIEQPANILLKYANQSDLVKQKYNVDIWEKMMVKLENNR